MLNHIVLFMIEFYLHYLKGYLFLYIYVYLG